MSTFPQFFLGIVLGLATVAGCRPYTPPTPVPEPEPGPIAAAKTATPADPSVAPPVPACITWRKLVRYRPYGYDHLVYIRSTCASDAKCVVTTDVSPKPITVIVAPNAEVEVVTFVGSPASSFEADVRCDLQS